MKKKYTWVSNIILFVRPIQTTFNFEQTNEHCLLLLFFFLNLSYKFFVWKSFYWIWHWITLSEPTSWGCRTHRLNLWNVFKSPSMHVRNGTLNWLWALSRCPWCNGYRRRKWTRRHEFKFWTRLICISHRINTLGKGMNPIILPPAMGKIVGQTWFFSLGEVTSLWI